MGFMEHLRVCRPKCFSRVSLSVKHWMQYWNSVRACRVPELQKPNSISSLSRDGALPSCLRKIEHTLIQKINSWYNRSLPKQVRTYMSESWLVLRLIFLVTHNRKVSWGKLACKKGARGQFTTSGLNQSIGYDIDRVYSWIFFLVFDSKGFYNWRARTLREKPAKHKSLHRTRPLTLISFLFGLYCQDFYYLGLIPRWL